MSDEVSLNENWTLAGYISHNESMRDETDRRYEQRFVAQERAVEAALTSAKEAVLKAETASEKRFEGVNEFRATLADQAATLISRTEVEQVIKALDEKVDAVTGRMDRLDGRSGGLNSSWGYLIGGIMAAGALLTILGGIIGAVIYVTVNK